MTKSEKIAARASSHLLETIETLDELCAARRRERLSYMKFRRIAIELRDLAKLLAIYSGTSVDNRY